MTDQHVPRPSADAPAGTPGDDDGGGSPAAAGRRGVDAIPATPRTPPHLLRESAF
ncbi:hypothetical protein GCM10009767_30210 [Kocuria aegyptia]|uniref:Uncharacterized protein n=1 Tax=Kocuria aegyptia TaxID=330943 RepID=A0ABN2KZI6_9MICC